VILALCKAEWDMLDYLLSKHLKNGGYYDTVEILKDVAREYARLKFKGEKLMIFLRKLSEADTLKYVIDILLAIKTTKGGM